MNQIFAVGYNTELKRAIINYAYKNESIIIEKDIVTVTGNKNLLIFDKPTLNSNIDTGIIAFLSNSANYNSLFIPKGFIGVCEGNNKNALKCLMQQKIKTVTFGMSPIDTVTFSSIKEKNAQISLQRQITDLKGNCVEPLEFSIEIVNDSPIASLLNSTIMLLSGENKINSDKI